MKGIKSRLLCTALAVVMLLAGCGQPEAGMEAENKKPSGAAAEEEAAPDKDDKSKAMGRYVETALELPEEAAGRPGGIVRMNDGSLKIFVYETGFLVSKDEGAIWNADRPDWLERLEKEKAYIMDVALSKDGAAAVTFIPEIDDGEDTAKENGQDSEKEAAEDAEEEAQESGTSGQENGLWTLRTKHLLAAADGTETILEISGTDEGYFNKLRYSDDGRLFGLSIDGKIYAVDAQDGSARELAGLTAGVRDMVIGENFLVYSCRNGIRLYDMQKEEELEDNALDEFVRGQLGGRIDYSAEGVVPVAMLLEQDSVLYLICAGGIFRHVIGGSAVEQAADGAINTLGDPTFSIVGASTLPDDRFLVLSPDGRLILYSYDPDMPAVPEVQIKAYSLNESAVLKQAITKYQNMHPESYVQYEIGMADGTSMTRDDALKKLNTEIMAGHGPDLLLLDDMPLSSYMEKGILLDLTPYLKDVEKGLLPGIAGSFRTDAGLLAIPTEFMIPLIAGDEKDIVKVTDLSSLASLMEELRSGQPQGEILGLSSEEELLHMLLPVCVPAWKDESGKIREEALKEFLTLSKRIWEAESAGISVEEKREEYETSVNGFADYSYPGGMKAVDQAIWARLNFWERGKQKLVSGMLNNEWNFITISSVFRQSGRENEDFTVWNGQASHTFQPKTIAGINAMSSQPDAAGELIRMMLGEEEMAWYENFPVSRSALNNVFTNTYSDSEDVGSTGASDENGIFTLQLYYPDKAQIARIKEIMEEADTPYLIDSVLEDAVYEIGRKALAGEKSVEDAVRQIIDQTAIYMAE